MFERKWMLGRSSTAPTKDASISVVTRPRVCASCTVLVSWRRNRERQDRVFATDTRLEMAAEAEVWGMYSWSAERSSRRVKAMAAHTYRATDRKKRNRREKRFRISLHEKRSTNSAHDTQSLKYGLTTV